MGRCALALREVAAYKEQELEGAAFMHSSF
jgi:hypothetical protein